MFRAYGSGGGGGDDTPEPPSQYGAFASFPKRGKVKTQVDYDEEIRIKLKRQQDANKRLLQQKMEELKEQMTYKAIRVEDSDDSDCEPMIPTGIRAVTLTTGGSVPISESTRKALNDSGPRDLKRRKESKRRRSSSSSSSSSRDRSRNKKKKRRKSYSRSRSNSSERNNRKRENDRDRKKHKKSKKRRRRSSSSSSASSEAVRPSTSSSAPSGYLSRNQRLFKKPEYKLIKIRDIGKMIPREMFVQDYHYDRENRTYDTVMPAQRSEVAPYAYLLPQIITNSGKDVGKDERAIVKDTGKKREKPTRFHLAKPSQKRCENEFRALEFPDDMDFIPLSHMDASFKFKHEIAEEQAEEERRQNMIAEIRRESTVPLDDDQMLMNARLKIKENPKDPEAYIAFIEAEDAAHERKRLAGTDNSAAHNERKIAILDQGIKCCPKDAKLRLERAKLIQIQYPDKANEEWEKLLHTFVNSLSMWRSYLDSLQYDGKVFDANKMEMAFRKCLTKLSSLQSGEMKSHSVEAGTDDFQFKVFLRRLMLYVHSGFFEIAIASVQAMIEFTYCPPRRVAGLSLAQRKEEFKKFWESGMPRIGDKNWQGGWSHFDQLVGNAGRDPQVMEELLKTSRRLEMVDFIRENAAVSSEFIRTGARKGDKYDKWLFLERNLKKTITRPQRNPDNRMASGTENAEDEFYMDEYRYVPYQFLILFNLSGWQLSELLEAFGVNLFGFEGSCPATPDLARAYGIADSDPLLPVSGMKILLRISRHLSNTSNNYQFLFSLPKSYARLIPMKRSYKVRVDKFKAFVAGLKGMKVPFPKKKKKNPYDSDDEDQYDDEEESMKILLEGPKKNMHCRMLDCFSFFAVMTTKALQGAEPHRRAFMFMDDYVTRPLESKVEYEIVFEMILMIIETVLHCEKKDREERERMIREKLIRWICKIARPDLPEESHTILTAQVSLELLNSKKFEQEENSNFGNSLPQFHSLVICLKMWLGALRVDSVSSKYMQDCYDAWSQNQYQDNNSKQAIHQTLLLIMNREWTTRGRCKDTFMNVLEEHGKLFPNDPKAIQVATDMLANTSGIMSFSYKLDKIFGDYGGGEYGPIRRALAHVAVVEKKLEILRSAQSQDVHTIKEIERFLSGLVKREAEKLHDPYFWRMAMKYAQTPTEAQDIYVRAAASCRWSREIHFMEIENARGNEIRQRNAKSLMDEAKVRLAVDINGDLDIADARYNTIVSKREQVEQMANSQ